MRNRMELLLAGRARDELGCLESLLNTQGDIHVTTRLLVNGDSDPLQGISVLPDALVLLVSDNWAMELAAFAERPAADRPPLLVVGPKGNVELIRDAMRAGARDFFSPPIDDGEISQFIRQLSRDRLTVESRHMARLTAVINAKGGSGASMIAANLAHRLAVEKRHTVLVDMDVQFGSLPLYFNMAPGNGLVGALEAVDSLDVLALEGYVQGHASGLDLLTSSPEHALPLSEVSETRVEQLLQVLGQAYDDVVVDLPRWIGGSTAAVLERSDRILMVMQQSVAHLRDAQRLLGILRHELQLATPITLVVNRHDKRSAVSLGDIREALPGVDVLPLVNDYKHVNQSINVGSPLRDVARKAPVTRALKALALSFDAGTAVPSRSSAPARKGLLGWTRLGRA